MEGERERETTGGKTRNETAKAGGRRSEMEMNDVGARG